MRKAYRCRVDVWIEAPTEEAAKDRLIELMEKDDAVMDCWTLQCKEVTEDA